MTGSNAPPGEGHHETRAEVRYGETDQMGYAHHAVAVSWFELGRVLWMREHGLPYGTMEARGILMPVVKMEIQYHAPGRFEDQLAIQTRLTDLGRSRVTFENRVFRLASDPAQARTLLVEGRVELACVDRQGQIQRLPQELRAQFERFLSA